MLINAAFLNLWDVWCGNGKVNILTPINIRFGQGIFPNSDRSEMQLQYTIVLEGK